MVRFIYFIHFSAGGKKRLRFAIDFSLEGGQYLAISLRSLRAARWGQVIVQGANEMHDGPETPASYIGFES